MFKYISYIQVDKQKSMRFVLQTQIISFDTRPFECAPKHKTSFLHTSISKTIIINTNVFGTPVNIIVFWREFYQTNYVRR